MRRSVARAVASPRGLRCFAQRVTWSHTAAQVVRDAKRQQDNISVHILEKCCTMEHSSISIRAKHADAEHTAAPPRTTWQRALAGDQTGLVDDGATTVSETSSSSSVSSISSNAGAAASITARAWSVVRRRGVRAALPTFAATILVLVLLRPPFVTRQPRQKKKKKKPIETASAEPADLALLDAPEAPPAAPALSILRVLVVAVGAALVALVLDLTNILHGGPIAAAAGKNNRPASAHSPVGNDDAELVRSELF